MTATLGVAAIAYLFGSIPFGLLLSRAAGVGDIRKIGSGNIGATNVLRTGRKGLAAATLLLDALKGAAAVLAARVICGGEDIDTGMAVAAIAVVIGHCFPIWLGFRGGKGVATGLGVIWALCWPAGALCCLVWLLVARLSRFSSAGALAAFCFAPVFMTLLTHRPFATPVPIATTLLTLLILVRHQANIARLISGQESHIQLTDSKKNDTKDTR